MVSWAKGIFVIYEVYMIHCKLAYIIGDAALSQFNDSVPLQNLKGWFPTRTDETTQMEKAT